MLKQHSITRVTLFILKPNFEVNIMNKLSLICSEGDILDFLEITIIKNENVLLRREVLSRIIERCINAEFSESVLKKWAEEIELTDNVIYENGMERQIADTLFYLSSGEINNNISLSKLLTSLRADSTKR